MKYFPPLVRTVIFLGFCVWFSGRASAEESAALPLPPHPRLFIEAGSVEQFRARAGQAPWKDMLAAIEWAMENDLANEWMRRPSNPAALYLFRGDGPAPADWSEQALRGTLAIMAHPEWAQPGASALTRAAQGITVALAYDLCYPAWGNRKAPADFVNLKGEKMVLPAPYAGMDLRSAISLALKNNSDSLIASGGAGFPGSGKEGNNWWGIRFAAAGLGYLASDEPPESWEKNLRTAGDYVKKHLESNLSADPRGRGWNPEGIAYAQFAGWFTHPFVLAMKRLGKRDLVAEVPGLRYALWATFTGVLPIERYGRMSAPGETRLGYGRGLRPDFDDDHDGWDGEGTGALAFAFAPPEYLPGLKWQFRRLVGDLGDHTWDSASGNGLYALLFYPEDIAEKNPSELWGLTYEDPTYGAFMLRSRFQDENDFVFQTTANLRSAAGGHDGPDALSFRLWGLGVPWAVGSGRDYSAPHRGQTTIFPDDPEEMAKPLPGVASSVLESFLRRNGDGLVRLRMETSDTGVTSQERLMIVDYSGESGAPGFFVIGDRSQDGRFWRLNTPGFNTISVEKGSFTITSPDGHILRATILHPPGVTPRTGTFTRGNGFQYREVGLLPTDSQLAGLNRYDRTNRWVDFQSPDGHFLVAMTVTPSGTPPPAVKGDRSKIVAGTREIRLHENHAEVNGWTPPAVTLPDLPGGRLLHVGLNERPVLRGHVEDPEGVASLSLLRGADELARIENPKGDFSLTIPLSAACEYDLALVATDQVGDSRRVPVLLQITKSAPPVLTFDAPESMPAVREIPLSGTVRDPDGKVAGVELQRYRNHPREGWGWENLATVEPTAEGTWAWSWSLGKSGPTPGYRRLRAVAIDDAADRSETVERTVKVCAAFSKDPGYGDAADFHIGSIGDGADGIMDGKKRWGVVEEDGDARLRVRERQGHEYGSFQAFLRDPDHISKGDWRLKFRFKMAEPLNPEQGLYVFFGQGTHGPVVLDLRTVNTRVSPGPKRSIAGEGTRVWSHGPNGNRPHVASTLVFRKAEAPEPGTEDLAYAGIPGPGWHEARIERTGRRLRVWINDKLILDAESPWIATPGAIGLGNERLTGATFFFDDLSLTALPESPPSGSQAADPAQQKTDEGQKARQPQ